MSAEPIYLSEDSDSEDEDPFFFLVVHHNAPKDDGSGDLVHKTYDVLIDADMDVNHDNRVTIAEIKSRFLHDHNMTVPDGQKCDFIYETTALDDDKTLQDYPLIQNKSKIVMKFIADSDDMFGAEEEHLAEYGAVRPWVGSCFPPSKPPANDPSPPDVRMDLEWINGYKCKDSRSNCVYNARDEIVYPVAGVVVTMNTRKRTQSFYRGHNDDVLCLAQHPTRPNIVATGQTASVVDGKKQLPRICVHDTSDPQGKDWVLMNAGKRCITNVAFSSCGKYLTSTDNDDKRSVSVWDWESGAAKPLVTKPSGAGDPILHLRWNHKDPSEFVTVGKRHAVFWSWSNGSLQSRRAKFGAFPAQTLYSIAFSQKGYACLGAKDGSIYVFVRGECKKVFKGMHAGKVNTIEQYENGLISGGEDGRVCVLDSKLNAKSVVTFARGTTIRSVDVKDDGGTSLVVGTSRGEIFELRNFDSMESQVDASKFVPVMHGHHDGELWAVAHSPTKSDEYATVGEDNKVMVWSIKERKLLRQSVIATKKGRRPKKKQASTTSSYPVNQCARVCTYSPDGAHLALGTNNGELVVVDAATLRNVAVVDLNQFGKRKIFKQKQNWIQTMVFSPDGRTLAVGTHGIVIVLIDVRAGYKPLGKLKKHSSAPTAMDWSVDGKQLRSVDLGYELLYYDINTRSLSASKQNTAAKKFRDTEWASHNVQFGWDVQGIGCGSIDGSDINTVHVNGDLCVTGDDSGRVNVFRMPVAPETVDGEVYSAPKNGWNERVIGQGHSSHVMRVCVTTDGRRVLSTGGGDMAVFQWKL